MQTHLFIIDDDLILRLLIIKMLGRLEIAFPKITQCENGKIGLDELKKIAETKDPVIVFLDINMPVLDGWGFIDIFEQSNCYGIQDINLFIVSSSTDEEDVKKAKEYDCVRQFIHKPLDFHTLKQLLKDVSK